MNYLLDTNVCIYIIKRKPESFIQRLSQIPVDTLFISVITVAELEYGVKKSSFPAKNQAALKAFLAPFSIVNFDCSAATYYGFVRE